MPEENEKISVTIKANLKKRDPDTKKILEEEETSYEITGNEAKQLMKQKGVNVDTVKAGDQIQRKVGKNINKTGKSKIEKKLTNDQIISLLKKKGVIANGSSE